MWLWFFVQMTYVRKYCMLKKVIAYHNTISELQHSQI